MSNRVHPIFQPILAAIAPELEECACGRTYEPVDGNGEDVDMCKTCRENEAEAAYERAQEEPCFRGGEWAAAQKAAQMGRKVQGCTLQEARFPNDHFDCMSMSHVLEHVEDIKGLLAECVRVLKPGGYFMIGVPNFDSAVFKRVGEFWIGLQLPTHLHHFRMGSLKRLVLDAGLSIERAFSESLVPHVEGELVCHIRRRYKIPARILLRIHLIRPYAARVAAEAESSGRGEALVFRMRKAA